MVPQLFFYVAPLCRDTQLPHICTQKPPLPHHSPASLTCIVVVFTLKSAPSMNPHIKWLRGQNRRLAHSITTSLDLRAPPPVVRQSVRDCNLSARVKRQHVVCALMFAENVRTKNTITRIANTARGGAQGRERESE